MACTTKHSPAVRIALIEPSQADAHWFRLIVAEAGVPADICEYRTGVSALNTSTRVTTPAIDLIVVADVLPMLTLAEFVTTARRVQLAKHIVVTGEREWLLKSVEFEALDCYPKPLSVDDIKDMLSRLTVAHDDKSIGCRTQNTLVPLPMDWSFAVQP